MSCPDGNYKWHGAAFHLYAHPPSLPHPTLSHSLSLTVFLFLLSTICGLANSNARKLEEKLGPDIPAASSRACCKLLFAADPHKWGRCGGAHIDLAGEAGSLKSESPANASCQLANSFALMAQMNSRLECMNDSSAHSHDYHHSSARSLTRLLNQSSGPVN